MQFWGHTIQQSEFGTIKSAFHNLGIKIMLSGSPLTLFLLFAAFVLESLRVPLLRIRVPTPLLSISRRIQSNSLASGQSFPGPEMIPCLRL